MNQAGNEMKTLMETVLNQHTGSCSFESVWRNYMSTNRRKMPVFSAFSLVATAVIAVIALLTVSLVGFAIYRNIDKTDDSFVDDPRVLGQWEAVDFVKEIKLFNPDQPQTLDLYLSNMAFIKGGKMLLGFNHGDLADTPCQWTKNKILNPPDKTASKYRIKKINGITYLFFQWKNGEYIFGNIKPSYYVFKKLDSKDYSGFQMASRREDKVDFPFVDDAQMRGEWKSVDFVKEIGEFQPGRSNWQGGLFLIGLRLDQNGKVTMTSTSGTTVAPYLTWTKGLIIQKEDKTAAKCEVKAMNKTLYMFYEWKDGDYIFRGMKPRYYVLIKTQPGN